MNQGLDVSERVRQQAIKNYFAFDYTGSEIETNDLNNTHTVSRQKHLFFLFAKCASSYYLIRVQPVSYMS